MAPKDAHPVICGTCESVTSYSRKDTADLIKDLKMGRFSWITQVGSIESEESS